MVFSDRASTTRIKRQVYRNERNGLRCTEYVQYITQYICLLFMNCINKCFNCYRFNGQFRKKSKDFLCKCKEDET